MPLIRNCLLALSLVLGAVADPQTQEYAPEFYPFENGVKFETVEEGAGVLKQLGYPGAGSLHEPVLEEFMKAFKEKDLKIFSIYVGGSVGPEGSHYSPAITTAIAKLKGTKATVELYIQSEKGATDEHAVSFVREIALQAKQAGLRVAIYPHAGFYVETVDQALRIARASKADNVGVAFNLCHFLKTQPGADLKQTLEDAKDLLWSVSTSGADSDGKNWPSLIRPLDEGTFDQLSLLRLLREINYRGPIGLQCYGIKLDPKENLERSKAAWDKLIAELNLKPETD